MELQHNIPTSSFDPKHRFKAAQPHQRYTAQMVLAKFLVKIHNGIQTFAPEFPSKSLATCSFPLAGRTSFSQMQHEQR